MLITLGSRKQSSQLALSTPQGKLSWSQLALRVAGIKKQLKQYQLEQGDVLLIVTAHSSLELILFYLACIEMGVICALVPNLPYSELNKRIAVMKAKGVFVCPSAQCDTPKPLIIDFTQSASLNGFDFSIEHLTTLIFTSGSTGEPKAVAHSVSNHLASAQGIQESLGFDSESCWLLSLPLFHVSGLAIVWRWLISGCCLKLKQGKRLDLTEVTHTSMVPTQLQRVLSRGELGSLQTVLLGGSMIPHQLAQEAAKYGINVWAGYGLTEMASTVTAKQVNERDSVGAVLPLRELRLEGECIWVRGDTLAQGYWFQGELQPLTLTVGWFETKDLGYWLDGELVIVGRADNMFISGGENIHCEEIEKVLLSHSLIDLAFIIPVKDDTYGHRPVAMVAGASELTLTLQQKQQFNQHCSQQLQTFKLPVDYYFIPESLLSTGIKVSRKKLQKYLNRL